MERESFNEAPAQSWGKHKEHRQQQHLADSFNEAPAQSWGKLRSLLRLAWLCSCVASMRPQRKAGENNHR